MDLSSTCVSEERMEVSIDELSDSDVECITPFCTPREQAESYLSIKNPEEEQEDVAMFAKIALLESLLRSRDRTLMEKDDEIASLNCIDK